MYETVGESCGVAALEAGLIAIPLIAISEDAATTAMRDTAMRIERMFMGLLLLAVLGGAHPCLDRWDL
jgi:hypothetical protein